MEASKQDLPADVNSTLSERLWGKLAASKLPNWLKLGLVNVVAHVGAFWTTNALLWLIARYGLLMRFKIQDAKRFPKQALINEALKENILNDVVALPAVSFAIHKLLSWGSDESTEKTAEGETKTWSGLRFKGPLPSIATTAWQVAVGYFGYDFMFYWTHRALHTKWLYRNVHSQHHRFVSTIGVASSYAHALENGVQMLNWFVPIGVAGLLNGRNLHISTLFWYNCFRWVETVDAHCGYDFPWSPFSFIPLFGGAQMHDTHHSAFFGNYGASVLWDRLCGTENPLHRQWRVENGVW